MKFNRKGRKVERKGRREVEIENEIEIENEFELELELELEIETQKHRHSFATFAKKPSVFAFKNKHDD